MLLGLALGATALLGAGVLWRGRAAGPLRAAGWALLGVYFPFRAGYHFGNGDPGDAVAALLAPVALGWVALHEVAAWRRGDDARPLRWLGGVTAAAAAVFFVLAAWTPGMEALSHATAVQTSVVSDALFGTDSYAYKPDRPSFSYGFRASRLCLDQGVPPASADTHCLGAAARAGYTTYSFTVILACTSLHIMALLAAGALLSPGPPRGRLVAAVASVALVHVLNILRNALIIEGVTVEKYAAFGLDPWTFFHSGVLKAGSFVATVVIGAVLLRAMPGMKAVAFEAARSLASVPGRKKKEGAGVPAPGGAGPRSPSQ